MKSNEMICSLTRQHKSLMKWAGTLVEYGGSSEEDTKEDDERRKKSLSQALESARKIREQIAEIWQCSKSE